MRLLRLLLTPCLFIVLPWFFSTGASTLQESTQSVKTVKIGLLIPTNITLAAKRASELAVAKANREGGYNGKHFELSVRSMEGPWGTGSKQAVDLIFKENVCAIMGSTDGRNGHLIEQVSAKARIVFLSVWASDPTLAQAFVPWYFSCVPTDLQQADAFIGEIYNKRMLNKIAIVSDSGYDSKLAAESLVKRIKSAGKEPPLQFVYGNQNKDFNILLDQIARANVSGIIILGNPTDSQQFIKQLRIRNMNQSLFGALSLLNEEDMPEQAPFDYKDILIISPLNNSGSKIQAFREEYKNAYGKTPGAVAEYSYDGMNLLIEAIRKAGTDRENIQKTLAKLHFEGVTGTIQFDDKGKRMGTPELIEINNGLPVKPEH
jgi:branched-chain amino acid transport system substrate-binding protein